MRLKIILVPIVALLAGCWVYLSPTSYRCTDIGALYKYRQQPPGGKPGMTQEQIRDAYKQSGSALTLNDNEAGVFYFSSGECPIWRYRFETNRLVARGYLVMEGGVWSYVEID